MAVLRVKGLALLTGALIQSAALALASEKVEVIGEDNHGLSAPVRSLPFIPGARTIKLRPHGPLGSAPVSIAPDGALQEIAGPFVRTTPGLNVLGLGKGFVGPNGTYSVQFEPPDTNAAVGNTQVVETVNVSFAVFDKTTGTPTAGPTSIGQLWTGVDSTCSGGAQSDPVVLYDQLANRWVIEFIAGKAGSFLPPNKFCMAVSTSSDGAGTYNAYAFTDSTGLNDYSKVGIWPDAYYLSTRQFNASQSAYLGPRACAADRAAMIAGTTATLQCFQVSNTNTDGMLPSCLDGSTLPPAGSPNYFMLIPLPSSGSSNQLSLYKFHVDFTNPANSTFTGPTAITVAQYTETCSFRGCIPQAGTSNTLDGSGFPLMHRLAYRNFPGGTSPHESLVVTHNVLAGPSSSRRTAPRWYEFRSPGTTPLVFQQGTFSPDTSHRWSASIAMDRAGDIALGYSVSSSILNPSIRYTGRIPSDTAGAMEAEATILNGTGSQTGVQNDRWGDYSSMAIDPSDGCTFWYAQEYIPTNGQFNWATRLFSFKFNRCQ